MKPESTLLFYTNEKSDKIYKAILLKQKDGWAVNYEYGKRNSKLKAATKTTSPLSYEEAQKIYNSLIKAKKSKGYTEDASGDTYSDSELFKLKCDFIPQLLNAVREDEIKNAIRDWSSIFLQTKHDGERRGIMITKTEIKATNRKGLLTNINPSIHNALLKQIAHMQNTIIDCEDLGNEIVVFDILQYKNTKVSVFPFNDRANYLHKLQEDFVKMGINNIISCDIPREAKSIDDIGQFVKKAKSKNVEGVVLRNGSAKYCAGRPASGGPALKLKFVERATLKVSAVSNNKRSISIQVFDQAGWVGVGKCSIPSNMEIPKINQLVEIEYLYAYQGGSLFQPIYKGLRNDLEDDAAIMSQLKFKSD